LSPDPCILHAVNGIFDSTLYKARVCYQKSEIPNSCQLVAEEDWCHGLPIKCLPFVVRQ
jgi:hypothetical protein